jgi:hypothetical protein
MDKRAYVKFQKYSRECNALHLNLMEHLEGF